MRDFRKKQREEDKQLYDFIEEFIQSQMANGSTREQAEELYKQSTTPSEQQTDEATDSVPETKPECFGKQLHKGSEPCTCTLKDDCYKTWIHNMFKPKAQKDAERRQKIIDVLNRSKALLEDIQRKKDAELWAKVQAQNDAAQKELDALVKKYTDQGIPEATARESAKREIKQKQNVEIQRNREFQRKWDLMTDEEKTAAKMKILKDSRKLREGDASHE